MPRTAEQYAKTIFILRHRFCYCLSWVIKIVILLVFFRSEILNLDIFVAIFQEVKKLFLFLKSAMVGSEINGIFWHHIYSFPILTLYTAAKVN